MSKAVLISVNPGWCELIASGEKTVEVRKTKPKLETPFKVYIYCTNGAPYLNRHNGYLYLEAKDTLGGRGYGIYERLSGKVIGEFVCDSIEIIKKTDYHPNYYFTRLGTCLEPSEMWEYGKGKPLYAWHISDLVIYDKAKEFDYFRKPIDCYRGKDRYDCVGCWDCEIKRPPQSWCYVEEV